MAEANLSWMADLSRGGRTARSKAKREQGPGHSKVVGGKFPPSPLLCEGPTVGGIHIFLTQSECSLAREETSAGSVGKDSTWRRRGTFLPPGFFRGTLRFQLSAPFGLRVLFSPQLQARGLRQKNMGGPTFSPPSRQGCSTLTFPSDKFFLFLGAISGRIFESCVQV